MVNVVQQWLNFLFVKDLTLMNEHELHFVEMTCQTYLVMTEHLDLNFLNELTLALIVDFQQKISEHSQKVVE